MNEIMHLLNSNCSYFLAKQLQLHICTDLYAGACLVTHYGELHICYSLFQPFSSYEFL